MSLVNAMGGRLYGVITTMRKLSVILIGLLGVFLVADVYGVMLERLVMPNGFGAEVFARDVTNARQMALGPSGVVFVGSRDSGQVYRIQDFNHDFKADEVVVIASGLYMPSGVAYKDGILYVAEVNRILALENPLEPNTSEIKQRVVFDSLPADSHHGWKAIDFGPDGKLYVPVGAPCNVCEVSAPYGTILRLDLADRTTQIYARGVRNSVGFAWHPSSKKMWFSDNGRDWMGDDVPGCEINRVDKPGQHFGFPYVHAAGIADDTFTVPDDKLEITLPKKVLGAHVAPLGLLFYSGQQFPENFNQRLFVAEHGSWNRTKKAGYRIMTATISDSGEVESYQEFATGWLQGQAHWGRPVDIEQLPDGSLLVSDDYAGVIYRISYQGPEKGE